MNTKAVLILAAATTVLVALVALLNPGRSGPPVPDNAGALFPDLPARANDLATIEITTNTDQLTLAKQDSAWVLPAKDNYPASIDEVRRLVTQLQTLEPTDRKTADPTNHPRLGLTLPNPSEDAADNTNEGTRVRLLTTGGNAVADLILGITTNGNQFIRRADADQTWLIESPIRAEANPTRWFDPRPVQVERDEVRRITIEHPDGETVTVIKANDDFTLENIPDGRELVGPWAAGQIAGALGFINVTDVASDAWMQDAEVTTITYELEPTTDDETGDAEQTLTVRLAERNSQPWATFRAAGPGADEVNAITQGWSYQISSFTRDTLTKRLEDLLKPLPEPTETPAGPEIPAALTPPADD